MAEKKVALRARETFGKPKNRIEAGTIFVTDPKTAEKLCNPPLRVAVAVTAQMRDKSKTHKVGELIVVDKGGGNYDVTTAWGAVVNETNLRGFEKAVEFAQDHEAQGLETEAEVEEGIDIPTDEEPDSE